MVAQQDGTLPMTNDARGRFRVRAPMDSLIRFVRTRMVLIVSAAAALITMVFVPFDEAYLGYFDVKTLACLFGILAVVGALRGIGLFEQAARLVVARFATCRAAVTALVGATLALSMFATNDMALIMMLPLAAATLIKAGWERALPFAFIMQNLAANLGGMILPFGNPQNLYLYERFSIPLGDFLAVMALPFGVSVALIALCCALFLKPDPPQAPEKKAIGEQAKANRSEANRSEANPAEARREAKASNAEAHPSEAKRRPEGNPSEGNPSEANRAEAKIRAVPSYRTNVSRETFVSKQGRASAHPVTHPHPATHPQPVAQPHPAAQPHLATHPQPVGGRLASADRSDPDARLRITARERRRVVVYFSLLALVIASVFRLVPYPVALAAVVLVLAVFDRRALRTVDYGLLLTFACFFVFAGNMARIPVIEGLLSGLMGQSALLASVGTSQIISNVPAAVLLSHFAGGYEALLVGVNIGGAGTLVASLASLITFNQYRTVLASFPHRPELARNTSGAFLARFTAYNVAFLAVLLLVCWPLV